MNVHALTVWELASTISEKLNCILHGREVYRKGLVVPFPKIEPEDILERATDRLELEQYYIGLTRKC